jgi:hypothetical protein
MHWSAQPGKVPERSKSRLIDCTNWLQPSCSLTMCCFNAFLCLNMCAISCEIWHVTHIKLHQDWCNAESSARVQSFIAFAKLIVSLCSVCVCSLGHVLWLITAHLIEWRIAGTKTLHSVTVVWHKITWDNCAYYSSLVQPVVTFGTYAQLQQTSRYRICCEIITELQSIKCTMRWVPRCTLSLKRMAKQHDAAVRETLMSLVHERLMTLEKFNLWCRALGLFRAGWYVWLHGTHCALSLV